MKEIKKLQIPQPMYPQTVDKFKDVLGQQKWRQIRQTRQTFHIYKCYCCYDTGLLPVYLAEQVMEDYDMSICQIICPLCDSKYQLSKTYLASIGYYQTGLDKETAVALHEKEMKYWINRIKEVIHEEVF